MAVVKPIAARALVALAVCLFALQWLGAGTAVPAAGLQDSHAEACFVPDDSPCGAGHGDCSLHLCTSLLVPAVHVALAIEPSASPVPEPGLLFADYLAGRSLPPPLALPV